jgi:cytochrome c oxidase assembly factor CtaG
MEPGPWTWEPAWGEIALVAVVAVVYGSAVRRFPTSRRRIAAFAAGLVLTLGVLATPVDTIALHYLLAAHLFQNVALAEWVPALLVLGLSPPLAARLSGSAVMRALTLPYVALPLWLVTYAVWHVPAIYDAALRDHALLHLEHACYLVAGLLLWWPVFQDAPHDLTAGRRAAYVFAAFVLASPLGFFLSFVPEPIYDFYEAAPRIWGLSPLADQQIAGVIMSVSEAVVFFAVFAFFLFRFFADEGG